MIIDKADRILGSKPYYFATKLKQVAAMNAGGLDVLNLGIGSPDLPPPKTVLNHMEGAVLAEDANRYQAYRGVVKLRAAFAEFYHKWFDVTVNDETEVLPLQGSKEGIMHLSMSFLQADDIALVPDPGYPAYKICAEFAGAKAVPYSLTAANGWLPDLEIIASTVDMDKVKIMWINYPHMPSGAKASKAFYLKLIQWAHTYEVLICSDNPYNFILNDEYLSPLQIDGSKTVCVELTSLSKCFNMAGWRVGSLVGAADYIDTVAATKSTMDSGMYKPIQTAAAMALAEGDQWFTDLNIIYAKRRLIAYRILDMLHCTYELDTAGMFVWAKLPDSYALSSAAFIEAILQQAHVFITPGHIFGEEGHRYIRISLCSTETVLEAAHKRIESFQNSST